MAKVKVAVYNIQYGSGTKSFLDYFKLFKFLKEDAHTIAQISSILKKQDADIAGFIEIDNGSWRANGKSQIKRIAEQLSLPFIFNESKYSESLRDFPLLGAQHHALMSKLPFAERAIYRFKSGFKKTVLISKIRINGKTEIALLLVHLSLNKDTRARQVGELASLIKKMQIPIILMGDFNAAPDSGEIQELLEKTGLTIVSHGNTFPSWEPTKNYDHIFVSKGIVVRKSTILPQKLSDHLPLIVELEIPSKVLLSETKQRAKMIEAL